MRGGNVLGRFDSEYEVHSIRSGISQDLQRPVGQSVRWFLYSESESATDDIYDVGSRTAGRVWRKPFEFPVVNAFVFQNELFQNERGFYQVDTLRLFVNYDDVLRYVPDLTDNPDKHIKDRCEFRGQMYVPSRIFPKGQVNLDYVVLTVDLLQVKPEEMINDVYTDTPAAAPDALYPSDIWYPAGP